MDIRNKKWIIRSWTNIFLWKMKPILTLSNMRFATEYLSQKVFIKFNLSFSHFWVEKIFSIRWLLQTPLYNELYCAVFYTVCTVFRKILHWVKREKSYNKENSLCVSWSWIHERTIFLRFLGIILIVLRLWGFGIQSLHYKPVSNLSCSGGGGGSVFRGDFKEVLRREIQGLKV